MVCQIWQTSAVLARVGRLCRLYRADARGSATLQQYEHGIYLSAGGVLFICGRFRDAGGTRCVVFASAGDEPVDLFLPCIFFLYLSLDSEASARHADENKDHGVHHGAAALIFLVHDVAGGEGQVRLAEKVDVRAELAGRL